MEKNMETTILCWGYIGIMERIEKRSYYSILRLYWDTGKENGSCYNVLGLYWENGKDNGN